jgi:hypothetical protein
MGLAEYVFYDPDLTPPDRGSTGSRDHDQPRR